MGEYFTHIAALSGQILALLDCDRLSSHHLPLLERTRRDGAGLCRLKQAILVTGPQSGVWLLPPDTAYPRSRLSALSQHARTRRAYHIAQYSLAP